MKEWHPSTAQELFQSADDILAKYGVQWNNCTLLGVVNTNTNIGNQRTASEKSPAIKISVCTCHVPHNDAVKALKLQNVVQKIIVLIYVIGLKNQVSKNQPLKSIVCYETQNIQKSFDMYLLGSFV